MQEIKLDLDYVKFNDMAVGDKYFHRPGLFEICRFTLRADPDRKTDFYFDHPLIKSNTTEIEIPVGYEGEKVPSNQSFKCKYGFLKPHILIIKKVTSF